MSMCMSLLENWKSLHLPCKKEITMEGASDGRGHVIAAAAAVAGVMEQEQDPAVQEDENIKAIKEEYKKAFSFVNKGLNTDELGQKEEARNYYKQDSGEFSSVGEEYYKKCTRPPSLESLGVDADELILIPQGVQIFYVTPDGQVSAPSYPGYLRIIRFLDTDSEMARNRPPAFLQVCDWLYPLMCDQSPVLCCNSGVYMFPDMMSQVPGSHVGVVLSSELPAADRELFEDLLKQMSDLRIQPSEASSDVINLAQTVHIQPQPESGGRERVLPEWSEKVAHGILSGASWVSWGLIKGAEYTGKAIHKGASKLREHIQPEEKPLEINPTVAKGLHVAKQATGGAVKVSQFLVEGVCSIASCVGKELAPHVKKHGSKLVPESLKKDKDGKSTFDGALVVAASGIQGFSTVWQGLESAAKCIAKSVSSETVNTVKYKYKNRKHGDQQSTATKSEKH
ncbi:spartin isoform B [Alligator mississippiensis]|uniref:Spartin isoform B n=1 Tax=Alligator mississippiensis TaxID=8496 RepID=A0A151MPV9_ALLMI|nr:spartin isoform B [Alligator mississippiensis]